MYSSTVSLTSTLDEVVGQRHAPADLSPEETRYPLYKRRSEPQGRSAWVRIISPTLGFDTRTAHPVASRYADCFIPIHAMNVGLRD